MIGGGKFSNGAVTGAFTMWFNHLNSGEGHPDQSGGDKKYKNGDGIITYDEAYWTFRLGEGKIDLFADLSKLDLSKIKASDFPGGVGSDMSFNFASEKYFTHAEQALVYGNITLRLLDNNMVVGHSDTYDFDIRFTEDSFMRDVLTLAGHMYNGLGTPFQIHFRGSAYIQP